MYYIVYRVTTSCIECMNYLNCDSLIDKCRPVRFNENKLSTLEWHIVLTVYVVSQTNMFLNRRTCPKCLLDRSALTP